MPAISIIVPIYNMERLMRRCIDSLLAQSFKDFELLLIDDGSKDSSWSICQEYAERDPRVFIFHKENGGLSDTRNFGLQHAHGQYSIFADPDDWVSPEGLNLLYDKALENNADIVMCDIYHEDEYVRHYTKQEPSALDHNTVLKELFVNIGGFTVNKLIKTSLYQKYGIEYPKGIYGCEDQYTMAAIFKHNVKITYVPIAFYHYLYYPVSLARYYDENTYEMDLHILQMFKDLLEGTPVYDYAIRKKQNSIFIRAFWNGSNYYSSKKFHQMFKKYKHIISSLDEPVVVKFLMWVACSGAFSFASKINSILFSLKQKNKAVKYRFLNK